MNVTRRGARVVEWASLERMYVRKGIKGSNPFLSAKQRNRFPQAKSHRRKPQMEGGAEFPPETPLPPRPLHCWIFLGFLSQMQRAHEAKKRGCGRGPEASHRLLLFSSQNTKRSCSK